MPSYEIVQVDAFASRPFTGNPAAVMMLDEWPEDSWLQNVALEMNLSETAFVAREDDEWRLRWFTPAVEVDLCGHATLATAHVLFSHGHQTPGSVARFRTRSGVLTAAPTDDGRIELDFPADVAEPIDEPPGLTAALGVTDAVAFANGAFDVLVEVKSSDTVRGIDPDQSALARTKCRAVIVTAATGQEDPAIVSRVFAPGAGVAEDPVTGSAHCTLACWWAERLGPSLKAHQASPRGGDVETVLEGDRVRIRGATVEVLTGVLNL
ncbi:MAG: PhzF family phenazine biosynthesis protein [Actinomycetia bacterium]|nr:PhzF family phenazine biosynthesis protein [Actinomycetes bacterium]MCP4087880.1 PhzF family phenazine biosynthesis protein [Actinomycetes bacterium]